MGHIVMDPLEVHIVDLVKIHVDGWIGDMLRNMLKKRNLFLHDFFFMLPELKSPKVQDGLLDF